EVPGDEALRPRTRDLLRALTAAHADGPRSQRLLRFLESGQDVQAEPLSPEHNAVLRALFQPYISAKTSLACGSRTCRNRRTTFANWKARSCVCNREKSGRFLPCRVFPGVRVRTRDGRCL